MLVLVELRVGVGTRSREPLGAAAGGGTNNIVSTSLLGSVSM